MVETTFKIPARALLFCGLAVALTTVSWAGEDELGPRPSGNGPQPLEAARSFYSPDAQLAALVAELLVGNPSARAARNFSLSTLEHVPQQRSLPDPQLSYRLFLSTPETRVGPQRQGIEISQGLPWSGKRALQARRAEHVATGMSWRARDLERGLVAKLKRAYFDAAYFQEALTVNTEETSLLSRFEQIALTRYSTGEGNQQNVIKVQTAITRLADQSTSLRQQLDATERRVAELVGRPETELSLGKIKLSLPDLHYDKEALEREAVKSNPSVFAVQHQVEADRTWVGRRQRDIYPDFAVALGYTDVGRRTDLAAMAAPPADNGQDIWSVAVKLNIPLYRGRIRAGVAEAEHSLRGSRQSLQHTQDRLVSDVQVALLRLDSLGERAGLYDDLLIPQAEESLASAEAAYTTNRQGFLDLLDAERVLFQVRLSYHRLLSDYWSALADVEQLIARPFPGEEDRP